MATLDVPITVFPEAHRDDPGLHQT
jgi:hypothetical protein